RYLNTARSTATQERVADAHVTGCGDRIPTASSSHLAAIDNVETTRTGIRNESRQERIRKVRVIQKVKEIRTQLEIQALCQVCVLEKSEVPLFVAGTLQHVASFIAVVARTRHAIRRRSGGCSQRCGRDGARDGKRAHVHVIERVVRMIDDWADHIRAIKSIPRTGVI